MTAAPALRASRTPTFVVLVVAGRSYAMLQSLVTPVLTTIQTSLHTSQSTVTWALTGPPAHAQDAYRVMLAVGAALYGMTYLFTSFIQGVMGDTAIQTAFVFLPFSVVTIVAAQASTKLLPRRRPTSFRRSRRNPSGSRTGHQSYRSEGGLTMLSLQEISDRLEIQDLFVRYAHAVDTCDWDLYRTVFTPDAHIDYTAFGAPAGGVDEIVAFLASVIPDFKSTQHAVANTLLTIDADTARARTICYNPMVRDNDGKDQITIFGLWYRDVLVRTPEGWRITHRSEERSYTLTDGALG